MDQFLALTVARLYAGAVYAITSTGLVLTYTTTGIFNFGRPGVAGAGASHGESYEMSQV